MPLQQTSGNVTQDAYGGGTAITPVYIEDVMSTFLYTGNGSTQTITNGIDLAGKGGLVWFKPRDAVASHVVFDTLRGPTKFVVPNSAGFGEITNTVGNDLTSFNSNGFSLGPPQTGSVNTTSTNFVSWTFREQAKFFDAVTYTGTGSNTTIPHNLGSVPGCIMIKRLDTGNDWAVYHQSNANTQYLVLNSTAAVATGATWWNSTTPTSTVFSLGTNTTVNASGGTYVAYLFAHNAGGFGLTGTDNVISCGSFTADGSGNASVTLGYEPQFWLYKPVSTGGWTIYDTMRGWSQTSIFNLNPNTSGAEGGGSTTAFYPTATGFDCVGSNLNPSAAYIYIAIRRGPMKVPTDGTKVYGAVSRAGTGATATVTTGSFPPDLTIIRAKDAGYSWRWGDRLRGTPVVLRSNLTNAELTGEADLSSFNMDGFSLTGTGASLSNFSGVNYINYAMGRAPSFFDEVCYTGTGTAQNISHNLAAVPELMIVKERNGANGWQVYSAALTNTDYLILNTTAGTASSATRWNSTTPTSTVFSVGTHGATNGSGQNFVNYLFATCAGVSKVGSYTGTGATQTISCGFTGGARFVLIKRTDSTGDWYVWDTARGMVSGTDPSLLLNSTAAEVNANSIYTATGGFQIVSTAAGINASGGTYIFLAIA